MSDRLRVRSNSMRQAASPDAAAARCFSVWPDGVAEGKGFGVEMLAQFRDRVGCEHPEDVVVTRVARPVQRDDAQGERWV